MALAAVGAGAFGALLVGHLVHHAEEASIGQGRWEGVLHLLLLGATLALFRLLPPVARGDRRALLAAAAWALGGLLLPGAGIARVAQVLQGGPSVPGALSGLVAEVGLGLLSLAATLGALRTGGGQRDPPP